MNVATNCGEQFIVHGIPVNNSEPIWIIYGTQTGNSMLLAEETAERLHAIGLDTKVFDMGDFKVNDLPYIKKLLVIVSTDGDGEPPIMAETLLEFLQSDQAPELRHLSYSILALGDTTYTFFCHAGKTFDLVLEKLGAKRMRDRVDCDVDYEEDYGRWIEDVLVSLSLLK